MRPFRPTGAELAALVSESDRRPAPKKSWLRRPFPRKAKSQRLWVAHHRELNWRPHNPFRAMVRPSHQDNGRTLFPLATDVIISPRNDEYKVRRESRLPSLAVQNSVQEPVPAVPERTIRTVVRRTRDSRWLAASSFGVFFGRSWVCGACSLGPASAMKERHDSLGGDGYAQSGVRSSFAR